MYYYIYDSFLSEGKYRKTLDKIETRLTDLDISGEIAKITPIRTIRDSLTIGIEKGYKTFVMVGNDHTITSGLDILIDKDITFGIIPIGEPNYIAEALGIPLACANKKDDQACNILSRRIIEKIDIGKINNKYFLTSCDIGFEIDLENQNLIEKQSKFKKYKLLKKALTYNSKNISLNIDERYKATADFFIISIINIKRAEHGNLQTKDININPKDKNLDILIVPKLSKVQLIKNFSIISKREYNKLPNISYFKAKNIKIESKEKISICADGQIYEKSPCNIQILPEKLKVVVGKERKF